MRDLRARMLVTLDLYVTAITPAFAKARSRARARAADLLPIAAEDASGIAAGDHSFLEGTPGRAPQPRSYCEYSHPGRAHCIQPSKRSPAWRVQSGEPSGSTQLHQQRCLDGSQRARHLQLVVQALCALLDAYVLRGFERVRRSGGYDIHQPEPVKAASRSRFVCVKREWRCCRAC
jgi:hypothetical protein